MKVWKHQGDWCWRCPDCQHTVRQLHWRDLLEAIGEHYQTHLDTPDARGEK